jgi:hypothetical protein
MSVLTKAVSIASAAAMLAMLNQGVATAYTPTSANAHPAVHVTSDRTCIRKPTHPNHPAEAGSPTCCVKPKTWQVNYSGGLNHTPKKYVWVCASIPRPPP